jgi:hypothetical protein
MNPFQVGQVRLELISEKTNCQHYEKTFRIRARGSRSEERKKRSEQPVMMQVLWAGKQTVTSSTSKLC